MQRIGHPEHIGRTARFLVLELAFCLIGSHIADDSGVLLA